MTTRAKIGWGLFTIAALCEVAATWLGSEQWAVTGGVAFAAAFIVGLSTW